jgi:reactive intermediate/imine deaminase
MGKKIISTEMAPAAIGAYSQAVSVVGGRTVYISGQIPLDPESMEIVSEEFSTQAHQVFKNLQAVAQASDASLADAVKLNVYLTDLGNFVALNEIMDDYIKQPYPARAAVQVSALPKGVKIEIDAILSID